MSAAAIQVLAIRQLDGKSTVKAFVDLQLGGVTIKGAKIVQQPDAPPWVAMPSVKSERGWQNVVELSKPLRDRVAEVVLAAWNTRPQTPGGAVLDAAPHRREYTEGPRQPWHRDGPTVPDDEIPF